MLLWMLVELKHTRKVFRGSSSHKQKRFVEANLKANGILQTVRTRRMFYDCLGPPLYGL